MINIITFVILDTPRLTIHHKNGKNKLGFSNLTESEIKVENGENRDR